MRLARTRPLMYTLGAGHARTPQGFPVTRVAQRLAPVLVFLSSACGRDPQPEPPRPDPPETSTPTPPDAAEPAPRQRSEPPPRPALPAGIQRFEKDVITLALSGDGRFLAGGDLAGKSLLWDTTTGRFLWGDPTPIGNRIGRVVFAEVGDVWVGGSFDEPDRPWRAWSADKLERRGEFGTPGEVAIDLALDKKGETAVVLTSTPDGERQVVSVWALASDRPAFTSPALMSKKGAVAIAPDASEVAASDDRGGLVRFVLGDAPTRSVLAEPSSDAVPDRVARLAYLELGARAGLWAASRAKLTRYPLAGATGEPETVTLADEHDPVRGLHRVARGDAPSVVAVTRPEPGGLSLWGLDGQLLGELSTGCRCETHAVSFDGRLAACGCSDASEVRFGLPRWR